jgi:hypothetical protein
MQWNSIKALDLMKYLWPTKWKGSFDPTSAVSIYQLLPPPLRPFVVHFFRFHYSHITSHSFNSILRVLLIHWWVIEKLNLCSSPPVPRTNITRRSLVWKKYQLHKHVVTEFFTSLRSFIEKRNLNFVSNKK